MRWMNGRIRLVTVALAMIGAVVAGGCSGGGAAGDKAGGSGEPVVLRLANTSGDLHAAPVIGDFVSQVKERSGGNLRIQVVNRWGEYAADAEQQVVRAVAAGKADLGWAGARVFDTMGVTSFQALQAPMLIDSYPLERAVVASGLPGQMLQGLNTVGVRGLGVLADGLHKPIAIKHPMLDAPEWRGITFGTFRSRIQAEAIRALGATPLEAFGSARDQALKDGKLQAFELHLFGYETNVLAPRAPYVTANVNLWPQMDVLLANPARLGALTDQQRGWLRQAASDAAGRSVALADRDARLVTFLCASGARFANASQADLATLRKAFAPVYASLQQDPQTKAFIQRIQALKQATPAGAPLAIPSGCTGKAPAPSAMSTGPALAGLNGTYRWTMTKQDAVASKTEDKSPEHLAEFPWTFTMTLKDGTWSLSHRENGQPITDGPATYALKGNRISFTWPQEGTVLTFTFSLDGKGNLHLRPVEPMNAGDQFVWATHVWAKIG
jgi:TRAP-type C4-dicarboxylate transport system substrate-binding protein